MMQKLEEIINYFPININSLLKTIINENSFLYQELQEIRIRIDRPILLKSRESDFIIDYKVNIKELLQILERICDNSIYAFQNQIVNGFITIKGGHRIGIVGTAVIENGKVTNLKYITSLNFRIAREVIDCSTKILGQIIDKENNTIFNTLIVSPPRKG